MQLTEKERAILGAVEHRGNASVESLRKVLRIKGPTIRYSLAKFAERGLIVGRAPFINVYPLGYTDYTIFFSPGSLPKQKKANLIQALIRSDRVSWVASLGGEYQLGVAITARRVEEVRDLFHTFAKEYQNIFYQKTISVRLRFTAFGRKYLSSSKSQPPEFTAGAGKTDLPTVDALDHQILSHLSTGTFRSNRELARQADIPFSTVERRLKRLEKEGIVCGYLYRFNLSSLGLSTYRLLIQSKGISAGLREGLYQYSKRHPLVLHLIECLGVWDYELGIEVAGPEAVNEIIEEIYQLFGSQIDGIKTLQIFRHLKYAAYPFSVTR